MKYWLKSKTVWLAILWALTTLAKYTTFLGTSLEGLAAGLNAVLGGLAALAAVYHKFKNLSTTMEPTQLEEQVAATEDAQLEKPPEEATHE